MTLRFWFFPIVLTGDTETAFLHININTIWDFCRLLSRRFLVIQLPFLLKNKSSKNKHATLDPDYIHKVWLVLYFIPFVCWWLSRRRSRKLVGIIRNAFFQQSELQTTLFSVHLWGLFDSPWNIKNFQKLSSGMRPGSGFSRKHQEKQSVMIWKFSEVNWQISG